MQDEETCYLVHDADGALQNHFFRAPKRHAFMRHLLHVLKVNALIEPVSPVFKPLKLPSSVVSSQAAVTCCVLRVLCYVLCVVWHIA